MGHFKYDRSWDWIMPVLAKIADAGYSYEIGRNMNGPYCLILRNDNEIIRLHGSTTLLTVWQAAIDFIDLYNSNQLYDKS
jgi:hypothetical protein